MLKKAALRFKPSLFHTTPTHQPRQILSLPAGPGLLCGGGLVSVPRSSSARRSEIRKVLRDLESLAALEPRLDVSDVSSMFINRKEA